jgi:hypothetical protein
VGFGDLAFFTAGRGFGDGGGLGAASGFDTFCSGSAGCLLGLAQRVLRGSIGFVNLEMARGLNCPAFRGVCGGCGFFGFSLRKKRLLPHLLCRTMSQLRAVLAARGGEIAIFGSMQIGP